MEQTQGKDGQRWIRSPSLEQDESWKSKEIPSIVTNTLTSYKCPGTCGEDKGNPGRRDLWNAAYNELEDEDKHVLFKVEATLQLLKIERYSESHSKCLDIMDEVIRVTEEQ